MVKDGNGEFPIGDRPPIPVPAGEDFPHPVPAKAHGGHSVPIPETEQGMHPRRGPRPRDISLEKNASNQQSRRRNVKYKTHIATT